MSAAELRFRAATRADVDAIVALTESAYRGDASRTGWTTEADLLDGQRTDAREVAELIANPGVRLLLAEHDGRLLACCVVERSPSLMRRPVSLPSLSVPVLPAR